MYGGLGAHVVALTQAQARIGHEVTVITQAAEGEAGSHVDVNGVEVIRVENHYPDAHMVHEQFNYWVHGFALASQAACEFMSTKPEIVHGHDWIAASQLIVAAKKFSVPSVLTVHATEFGRHNGWLTSSLSQAIYALERRALESANSVIVCSDYMTHEIRSGYGVEPKKLAVIANGVSPALSVGGPYEINPENIVIGFIGRLEWEKGVHHIIDAMEFIHDQRVKLEIVGRGSQLSDLQKKVERKGLEDRVLFLGHVEGSDRSAVVQSWNAAVIPSNYEPFGIVALELGQVGVPIIAAQVGGLSEIIPTNEYGYLIREVSGESIAREIESILGNQAEATERADRLRVRVATEFTWERAVKLTDCVYEKVGS
jgi:glycosyltransferase involved in cell wall biosynthesis